MSGWKDDDEVTTTYGSIQLSLEQAHAAGVKTERERIIKLLEKELGLTTHPLAQESFTIPGTNEKFCCDAQPGDSAWIAEDCCDFCTAMLWAITIVKGETEG